MISGRQQPPPRYSRRALPPYRHLPGLTPHPERHPAGHSFGRPEPTPPPPDPERWRENELFLYGVDLFNRGYWWEAHAAWESLWRQTERNSRSRRFFRGLIQLSAALLKLRAGRPEGAEKLIRRGMENLRHVARGGEERFMGVPIRELISRAGAWAAGDAGEAPTLVLYSP